MSCDSRLRDALRHAVDGRDLREDVALREVKAAQPTKWADFTVAALEEDLASRRSRHARTQRIVGVVAACALLAGAVVLPVALRNRPRPPVARPTGQSVMTGYWSTVTVRIGPAPSQRSTAPASTTTQPVSVRLGNPVQLALSSGIRNTALRQSHLGSNDPGIDFQATTDATGDVLSLTVIAPTGIETTTLARNWATVFVNVRRADARRQILEDRHNLVVRITELQTELRRVDTQLVTLAPATYKDLLQHDRGGAHLKRPTQTSSAPEQGSVKLLNLAFERIQILSSLTQSGIRAADLRLASVASEVFAQFVSQTPAVQIKPPHRDSNTSTTLIAIGLLLTGLVLATSAFLLSRRSRRRSPSP